MKKQIVTVVAFFCFLLNANAQPYERSVLLDFNYSPNYFVYGDLDGDDFEELIMSFQYEDFISIAKNDNGQFATPQAFDLQSTSNKRYLLIADINNDLLADIIYTDYDNSKIGILINKGGLQFEDPVIFNTHEQPVKITSYDFNLDNYNDLAVIFEGSNNISIFYADPNTLLSEPVDLETSSPHNDIEIGDINNDGFTDIVTSNINSPSLEILFGDINGFTNTQELNLSSNPINIEIEDIDNDGYEDIAAVFFNLNKVNILYGDQNNAFDNTDELQLTENLSSIDFIINDFNNDGIKDIVVSSGIYSGNIFFLIGNGDRTFNNYTSGHNAEGTNDILKLEYTDLTHSGKMGFLLANSYSVNIYENYPDASFQLTSYREFTLWSDMYKIDIGDINGDNINDIVVANRQFSFITIYLGENYDKFEYKVNIPSGEGTNEIKLTDLNNDGFLDIVAVGWEPSIFLNDGTGNFNQIQLPNITSGGESLVVGDFNNDGFNDIVVANTLYLNDQNNGFVNTKNFGYNINSMASLDFNNDSNLDLAITYYYDNATKIFPGNGDGTFDTEITISFKATHLESADINGDGFDDFIAADFVDDVANIYWGDEINPFSKEPLSFELPPYSNELYVLDIDRDGNKEIVFNDLELKYYPILTDATLGALQTMDVGMYKLYEVFSTDYDNDGLEDILMVSNSRQIKILAYKLLASISFENTEQIYDGEQVDDIVLTEPNGLDYQILYDGESIRPKNAGSYYIEVQILDNNFKGYAETSLTVNKALLNAKAENIVIYKNEVIPELSYTISGFVGNEDESVIDVMPTISLEDTDTSQPGDYTIIIEGGSDNNYYFEYENGVLTRSTITGINDKKLTNRGIYPNPSNDYIYINNNELSLKSISINAIDGRQLKPIVFEGLNKEIRLDVSDLKKGIYILNLMNNDDSVETHKIYVY